MKSITSIEQIESEIANTIFILAQQNMCIVYIGKTTKLSSMKSKNQINGERFNVHGYALYCQDVSSSEPD